MDQKIHLSIVIPAYREEKRIHVILETIEKYIKTKDFAVEVVVAIDASPDDTVGSAKKFIGRIPNLVIYEGKENRGKGGAVQDGIRVANGDYIIFADADNSTPVEQVDKLLKFTDKYEVIIGSRYCKGGKLAIPQSFTRRAGSRALNWMIQTLVTPGIKDTQCGFKLFSKEAAQAIFEKLTIFDFSFDIEVLAIAKKLGYKIKEEGITWHDDPHSTVSPLKDGVKMIVDSWNIRRNLQNKIY